MTAEEFKTVVDFLIEQKKNGQFRVIWTSSSRRSTSSSARRST